MQASQNIPHLTGNGQYPNGLTGEPFQSNDPLALAALILAELGQPGPGRTIIELVSYPPPNGKVTKPDCRLKENRGAL